MATHTTDSAGRPSWGLSLAPSPPLPVALAHPPALPGELGTELPSPLKCWAKHHCRELQKTVVQFSTASQRALGRRSFVTLTRTCMQTFLDVSSAASRPGPRSQLFSCHSRAASVCWGCCEPAANGCALRCSSRHGHRVCPALRMKLLASTRAGVWRKRNACAATATSGAFSVGWWRSPGNR